MKDRFGATTRTQLIPAMPASPLGNPWNKMTWKHGTTIGGCLRNRPLSGSIPLKPPCPGKPPSQRRLLWPFPVGFGRGIGGSAAAASVCPSEPETLNKGPIMSPLENKQDQSRLQARRAQGFNRGIALECFGFHPKHGSYKASHLIEWDDAAVVCVERPAPPFQPSPHPKPRTCVVLEAEEFWPWPPASSWAFFGQEIRHGRSRSFKSMQGSWANWSPPSRVAPQSWSLGVFAVSPALKVANWSAEVAIHVINNV